MKLTLHGRLNFNNFETDAISNMLNAMSLNLFENTFDLLSSIEHAKRPDGTLCFKVDPNEVKDFLLMIKDKGFYHSEYEFIYMHATHCNASHSFNGYNIHAKLDGFNLIIHVDPNHCH